MSELQQVKTYDIVLLPVDQIKIDPDNPNVVSGAAMQALRESMRKFGYLEPIVVDQNNKIANGEHRFEIYKEFGETKIPAIVVTLKSDAERRLLRQAMNKIHGSHDPFKDAKEFEVLAKADKIGELAALIMKDQNEIHQQIAKFSEERILTPITTLAQRFGVPPYSVLDTTTASWRQRKEAWRDLGIRPVVGRKYGVLTERVEHRSKDKPDFYASKIEAVRPSIFDPVLCEICYKWFSNRGGFVLDPYAGGAVRGIIASALGREYFGQDLRQDQVRDNQAQLREIGEKLKLSPKAHWLVQDSAHAIKLPAKTADLIFTCPPYGALEHYSDDPRDLSNMELNKFLGAYEKTIQNALSKLKDNRFAIFVVGDYRDKGGFYNSLPGFTIHAFENNGARLYNQLILLTPLGTLAFGTANHFQSTRKVGTAHQQVLVFYKGDPKAIQPLSPEDKLEFPVETNLAEL